MLRETKREGWVSRMSEFAASGQSQRRWCEQNGVPLPQFAYWRRRLKATADVQANRSAADSQFAWCPVQLAPELGGSGLKVRVGGACIEVEPGFDAGLLRAVVHALSEGACGEGACGEGAC